MKRARATTKSDRSRPMRPAITPEAREIQLISLATDLAEQQLRDGTASSQVVTHYLKLGSTKERLEMERLQEENKLLRAKTEAIESAKDIKVLYEEALQAMRSYTGQVSPEDD